MSILAEVQRLPKMWHGSGSLPSPVLEALATIPPLERSVETGTGKSTLLFSHISQHHTVFTKEDSGDGDSLLRVQQSPLLLGDNVEFIIGPTQKTVPAYGFPGLLDLAFLDGPHGYPFPELEYLHIYPHIKTGGHLIVDDCQIPTIARFVDFLKDDFMWEFVRTVKTTAFFRRTDAPLFSPTADGWWLQGYNKQHYPALRHSAISEWPRLLVPESIKSWLRTRLVRGR